MSCPHSLVADGPLEAHALLALEEALRVDLLLDRLELREAVRAPHVLLQRDALLFTFRVRKIVRTKGGMVGLERPKRVRLYVVVLRASDYFAFRGLWPWTRESASHPLDHPPRTARNEWRTSFLK